MSTSVNRLERTFCVNDLELHAIHWQPAKNLSATDFEMALSDIPVLCLHGWLDNAASFERLGAELASRGQELLALDFAGNGRSAHRSLHGYYNLWDDLIDIEAVISALGWKRFSLLGHSRGALVSALFASTQPEGLAGLMLLDGILPPVTEVTTLPMQLSEFLASRKSTLAKSQRRRISIETSKGPDDDKQANAGCLNSLESAWKKRHKHCDLGFDDMRPLLERALLQHGHCLDGSPCFRWTHDQRWLSRSLYRLSAEDRIEVLKNIRCPSYLLGAEQGRVSTVLQSFTEELKLNCRQLDLDSHSGGHHFHMEQAHYQSIATRVYEWQKSRLL